MKGGGGWREGRKERKMALEEEGGVGVRNRRDGRTDGWMDAWGKLPIVEGVIVKVTGVEWGILRFY